jgi:adenylate cyclase
MRRAPRRLTVLASLDVAGYTRLVEKDERGTLVALATLRRKILRPTLAEHGGTVFKTMGDGALIEFNSVEGSVEWALAFQTAMAEANAQREQPIAVRVGVALADVFVQGNDRFGAAVGFVVRLQQAAPPGGVAITHSVRWQLVKDLAAKFERTEWVRLKGMDQEFEVWLWTPGDAPTEPAAPTFGARPLFSGDGPAPPVPPPTPTPIAPGGGPPSIAVLAFDNMSGDPAVDGLVDGIVEEITATLSQVRDFTVIARNSAYAYKGRAIDVRDIGRELNVRYVLEGSLRKAGERVRVTAQLIDTESGAHIWADRYDGALGNLFDFEDQIAERVAGALHPSIRSAEIALAKRQRPENLKAYDLVLQAMPHLWAHRREENAAAIALLDRAIELDPSYGRAIAVAAWARAQHVVYSWTTDIAAERAAGTRLIEKAATTIGDDPTALSALATAVMLLTGDLNRAEHFIDRALSLDPNLAWAWTRRGFLNVYRGRGEDGIRCFEKAIRLSPLDPLSFNSYIGLGLATFAEGKPAEATAWTERAMREKAGMTWAYRDLATFRAHAGDLAGARDAVARLLEARPGLTVAQVGDALHFIEPKLLGRYLEGLRLAGLPE